MWRRIHTDFHRRSRELAQPQPTAAARWPDIHRPAYPGSFMLETGNVCNLRCPFCPTGRKERDVLRGLLTREVFEVILSKIAPHARFVSMVNWGEPFVNPDLPYFASRFREHGIRNHIDSNLSLKAWSAEEAEAIVSCGLSSILASIDGTTQEAYEHYRVKGDLAMALHNLRALREARDRLGLAEPFIGWAFYINRYNEHQVRDARGLAAAIGVPIWFKLLSCAESWKSRYHGQPGHPDLATPEWVPGIYPDWRVASIVEKPLHPALPGVCVLPFGLMVINWNGDAFPCDVVFGERYRLGNLVQQSLEEVWFGRDYVMCRSFLRQYGAPQRSGSVCQDNPCPVEHKFLPE